MAITALPNKEQDKHAAQLDAARRALGQISEQAEIMAKLRRAYYDAYIAQGFSAEQALDLCKQ